MSRQIVCLAAVSIWLFAQSAACHAALTLVSGSGSWDGNPPGTLVDVMKTMLGSGYDVNDPANRVSDSSTAVTDQLWTINSSLVTTTLMLELAGYRNLNSFGIYNLNTLQLLPVFSGPDSGVASRAVSFVSGTASSGGQSLYVGSTFGFYLKTPNATFYSRMSDNASGLDQMVTLSTSQDRSLNLGLVSGGPAQSVDWKPGEFVLAWEDLALPGGDRDYQDFLVKVDAVPVPEAGTLLAGALLLLPLALCWRRTRRPMVL